MNKATVANQTKTASFLPPPQGFLQRKCACGNHTVAGGECAECAKNKSGLQRKLSIGASNDPLELEADRVADQVMAAPPRSVVNGSPLRIQRYAGQLTEGTDTAPASVDRVLASSGRPLEPTLRNDMEQRFGHDFSRVRVHSGGAAEQSAKEVKANAYTVGHNVVFGAGQFAPGTHGGRRLLAHELTHVVQQGSADNNTLAQPSIQKMSGHQIMRSLAFDSSIKICHRVLTTRNVKVSQGGLRVVLPLNQIDTGIPNCKNHKFWITLTKSVDNWFDDEIATCEAETGGTRSVSFSNVSSGTYYLTIHRVFDHPYCCIEGDILVFDEPISGDSSSCVRDEDPSAMDIVHGALDIAGFIPVLGAFPDGINAIIYVAEGDWVNAGVSVVAMIPAIGDGAKAAVMGGKAAVKISAKTSLKLGEEGLVKAFKEAKAASKVEKVAVETTEEATKTASKFEKEILSETADLEKLSSHALVQVFRRGKKVKEVGAVSLKRLRNVVGRAGVSPSDYKLVKVSKEVVEKMEKEAGETIYGWVSRDGAGNIVRDSRGRPIINFTSRGLSSLEEAVKTFGHEVKHLQDFTKGLSNSSEALAELAGEKLWLVVSELLGK